MNPLHELQNLGQSVWYDNIRRALLESGQLARYREEYAVSGVTSNPTIFERAIAGSDDYDDAIREALDRGIDDPEDLFWELAVSDIRGAADVLRGVYDATHGADGYVSLELPPRVARDTTGSVELARRLAERVSRPNVMIKVPGTPEGVPAIEELTALGVNVNVTLLFSLEQWEPVAQAYLRGLERRLEQGENLDVASVASFFISRIDGKANDRLPVELRNRLAIANAQIVYGAYRELLGSDRWRTLAAGGARPQRLLWASTGTKDPSLPDTYYVTALAAPDTVNTMPEQTMVAFANHGEVDAPLSSDPVGALRVAGQAAEAGVDLGKLARELQDAGDQKFAESFDDLLSCVAGKVRDLGVGERQARTRLGPIEGAFEATVEELMSRDAPGRLWKGDHTLWQENPSEVADRLGWLDVPAEMEEQVDRLRAVAEAAAGDGLTHVLVLGMGGSSLFPLVAAQILGSSKGPLELHVLDSIDPAAVRRVEQALPLDRTLIIAASKSGATTEVRTLLEWFWSRSGDGTRFAVITDPGSPLVDVARDRGFRAVFENPPDIGGGYSALSYFGLVPATLGGADVGALLKSAGRAAAACADCVRPEANAGLQLGAILAAAARSGRDKLTLTAVPPFESFGLWVEQLVAESTGKDGTGIVPVVGEPVGPPEAYGEDRLFVGIGAGTAELETLAAAGHPVVVLPVDEPVALGGEVFRWEIAVALTGVALGINPFDQPDVEAAKDAARRALVDGVAEIDPEPLQPALDELRPGDYLAIQAYIDPADSRAAELERARVALRDRYRVATTLGFGPRYLHSTGQLHKGGPPTGVFVQVVDEYDEDPPIPGEEFGFATLERAQAAGDLQALTARGMRARRVRMSELLEVGR